MSDRQTLEQIAQGPRGWAQARAQLALDMLAQYKQGEISKAELEELMEDLVRTDRLAEEADDLELKAQLVTAVMALSKIA